MPRRSLPIASCPLLVGPTPLPMPGGHCSQCDTQVHDLAQLPAAGLRRLLTRPESVCVQGRARPDGSLVLHPAAAAATLVLTLTMASACAPLTAAMELEPAGDDACRDFAGFAIPCGELPDPPAPVRRPEAPDPSVDDELPHEPVDEMPPDEMPPDETPPDESSEPITAYMPPLPSAPADLDAPCSNRNYILIGGPVHLEPCPGGPLGSDGLELMSRRLAEAAPPPPPGFATPEDATR